MTLKILSRITLAAVLFSAIPFASVTAAETPTPSVQAQRLTNLRTRGAAEINRRVTNLNAALTKLAASTKLTQADKDALTGQINTELTSLTTLSAKLSSDTDLTMARADVQSIVTDHRVYALMLPRVRLVASVDRFAAVEEKLTELRTKLQAKVDVAKTGQETALDLTALQANLDSMEAKITSAKAETDGLAAKLLATQSADYNTNHALLVDFRASLKAAQVDLKAARDDARSVATALKSSK